MVDPRDPRSMYYQQMNQAAYRELMRQMQSNPHQAVFASAYGGTFVATPRPPVADVVVESPAIKPRVEHRRAMRLWEWPVIAALAVISIWPAWSGAFKLPAATAIPRDRVSFHVPTQDPKNHDWTLYKIRTKGGNIIYVMASMRTDWTDGSRTYTSDIDSQEIFKIATQAVAHESKIDVDEWNAAWTRYH